MPEPRDEIRLFVALPLPAGIQNAIRTFQSQTGQVRRWNFIRWTRPDQIHLTLKFIGATRVDARSEIERALEGATRNVEAFPLEAGELGCFPNLRRPRIVWAGVSGSVAALSTLEANVNRALTAWVPLDERLFTPHLTIGRIRNHAASDPGAVKELIDSKAAIAFGTWSVTQLDLMRSELSPEGSTYSCLATFPLRDGK